ncbi:transmembrane protein 145-like [Prorops nasuta]|uniref:transmembrane protein 145-like n=1 Tax=Prorops nasuta TaxID=863751 RepID=UPI0034CDE3A3
MAILNKLTIFFYILILLKCTAAKILNGQLVTRDNWVFLTRFCFLTKQGVFHYDFKIEGANKTFNLLLYYDSPTQWPSVYPSNKTCIEKESILSKENGQIVQLNKISHDCTEIANSIIHCNSYRIFHTTRPRWWFIALSNCASNNGLNVTYQMSLTNALNRSFWKEHFSADEFYILPLLIATICAYTILTILSFYIAWQLRCRRLLHVSYKIFISSLICQLFGVSLETYNYVLLGLNGIGAPTFYFMGNILEAISETLYTLLMLLLAFGYTVTKSVLTRTQIRWLLCFTITNIICQLSLFIYQCEIFDPGLVLYIYESPPGYGLLILKLIAWVGFVFRCFRTSKKMVTKFRFYASLLSLGSVWFLCHPLTVLTITVLVDKWVRESMAKCCSLSIVLLGHITFLIITRPSMANKRFPFHIRTCQIVPIGGEGQNNSYEPHTQSAMSAFTISDMPPSYSNATSTQ